MKNKIIAIIPARGGSKGIPQKNIYHLLDKPLIHYTIHAAQGSKNIHRIVVTSDDDEILKVSLSEGASVIKRPEEISRDISPTIDAIFHVLDQYEIQGIHPEIVVLLQPTSPLRTSYHIDAALELFLHNGCNSVISVVGVTHPPYWNMVIEESYLKPIFDPHTYERRRQDLPQTYISNGAIYIASVATLKENSSFNSQKTKPFIMTVEESIDIDNLFDLFLAETIMKRRIE